MTDLERRMTATEKATAELMDAVAGEERFGVRSGGLVGDMAEVKQIVQNGIKLRLSPGLWVVAGAIITGLFGMMTAMIV